MPVELKVPAIGESITEVQIGEWLKGEGQHAEKDENLVQIETDKATVELPAPISGTVTRVIKHNGETAAVGEVIGYMEEAVAPAGGDSASPDDDQVAAEAAAQAAYAIKKASPKKALSLSGTGRGAAESKTSSTTAPGAAEEQALVISPEVPREAAPASEEAAPPSPPAVRRETRPPLQPRPAAPPAIREQFESRAAREEEVVPMTPIRRRIAERLLEAQHTAALLTTFNEVDMSAVMALRSEHKDVFLERYGVKLGFMSFFVKATIDALKLVPQVNAEIRGTDIVYHNYFDIGIAVGGGKGLVVPVVRDADRLSFAEIEMTIADLAHRARNNSLALDELQGGTFTISNGGVYGSMLSTPIVNPPQSGILGLHAIQERPIARDGQVVIRPMMYLALTYDHRIVDGQGAVTFLKRIKDVIEEPMRMLVEI